MSSLKVIGRIHSEFPEKFGIPRQSNVVEGLQAHIIFEAEYRRPEALRGLEDFSHLWLLWGFSEVGREAWSPTVRPPRLGGNIRMGVFATRSPYRPNPIGLSCVSLHHIDLHSEQGPLVYVLGADIMDGTPIYDIKPYIPYTDSRPDAVAGFASEPPVGRLDVEIPDSLRKVLPPGKVDTLCDVLAQDPRPQYHNDPARIYGMRFAGFEIRFTIDNDVLQVTEIIPGN